MEAIITGTLFCTIGIAALGCWGYYALKSAKFFHKLVKE